MATCARLLLLAGLLLPAAPLLRAAEAPPVRPALRAGVLDSAGMRDDRHPNVTWKVIDHQAKSLGTIEYWDILLERHESAGHPGLIGRVIEKIIPQGPERPRYVLAQIQWGFDSETQTWEKADAQFLAGDRLAVRLKNDEALLAAQPLFASLGLRLDTSRMVRWPEAHTVVWSSPHASSLAALFEKLNQHSEWIEDAQPVHVDFTLPLMELRQRP